MAGLHAEAESWSDTPPRAVDGGPDMVVAFAPQGKGVLSDTGESVSGGLISYQGNQRARPHHPLDELSLAEAWGKYWAGPKVHGCGKTGMNFCPAQYKRGSLLLGGCRRSRLVRHGMGREQERAVLRGLTTVFLWHLGHNQILTTELLEVIFLHLLIHF